MTTQWFPGQERTKIQRRNRTCILYSLLKHPTLLVSHPSPSRLPPSHGPPSDSTSKQTECSDVKVRLVVMSQVLGIGVVTLRWDGISFPPQGSALPSNTLKHQFSISMFHDIRTYLQLRSVRPFRGRSGVGSWMGWVRYVSVGCQRHRRHIWEFCQGFETPFQVVNKSG